MSIIFNQVQAQSAHCFINNPLINLLIKWQQKVKSVGLTKGLNSPIILFTVMHEKENIQNRSFFPHLFLDT